MNPPVSRRYPALLTIVGCGTAFALFATGCASQGAAPSKTASGAGTGAMAGGAAAAIAGAVAPNSGINSAAGVLGGVAAGAIIGGAIGAIQESRDRREQDKLATERGYQQDLSRKRADDAKAKMLLEEELSIKKGFQISDLEMTEAERKANEADATVKALREERQAALNRTKKLEELQDKTLAAETEAASLRKELARLKGETTDTPATGPAAGSAGANSAGTVPAK